MQLRTLAAEGFHRLAEMQRAQRRFAEMEATARKLVELDPFDEAARRLLMTAQALQQRRNGALVSYQELHALLSSELGAEPEPETTELFAVIRSGENPLGEEPLGGAGNQLQNDAGATDPQAEARPMQPPLERVRSSESDAAQMASRADPHPTLLDKPSIAVLPFRNLGGGQIRRTSATASPRTSMRVSRDHPGSSSSRAIRASSTATRPSTPSRSRANWACVTSWRAVFEKSAIGCAKTSNLSTGPM